MLIDSTQPAVMVKLLPEELQVLSYIRDRAAGRGMQDTQAELVAGVLRDEAAP